MYQWVLDFTHMGSLSSISTGIKLDPYELEMGPSWEYGPTLVPCAGRLLAFHVLIGHTQRLAYSFSCGHFQL